MAAAVLIAAGCRKNAPTGPSGDPPVAEWGPPGRGAWEIVFRDEFDGRALDRTKWDPYYTWGRPGSVERHHNYDAWVLDENATVENGRLRLKCEPDRDNRHDYSYSTGVVTATRFVCRRGYYYEARQKLPRGATDAEYSNGLWPAFWLTGRGAWPPEIDIHEFFGCNNRYHATIHSTDGTERGTNVAVAAPAATTDFNVYAVHWRADDRVDVYYNGALQGTLNEPDPYLEMVMIINFGVHGPGDEMAWLGGASRNAYPQYYETDWVRVWRQKG
jgi:beta-glucanase (GH16 family)